MRKNNNSIKNIINRALKGQRVDNEQWWILTEHLSKDNSTISDQFVKIFDVHFHWEYIHYHNYNMIQRIYRIVFLCVEPHYYSSVAIPYNINWITKNDWRKFSRDNLIECPDTHRAQRENLRYYLINEVLPKNTKFLNQIQIMNLIDNLDPYRFWNYLQIIEDHPEFKNNEEFLIKLFKAISKLNKHVYKDVFDSMRKMIYTFSLNEIVKGWKQSNQPIYKLYQLVYYSKKYWRQPVSKKLLRLSRLG